MYHYLLHDCYVLLIKINMFSVYCDEDGWGLQINEEDPYPHLLHRLDFTNLDKIQVKGSSLVSFAGVVPFDLQPSSFFPVGFNLTWVCPEGMVFHHDWFANPYVQLMCQVGKDFDFLHILF